jgi:pyruvate-formate lyase
MKKTNRRIDRIRRRYQTETPRISIERARLYTEAWKNAKVEEALPGVRSALAMKHVFENMTIFLDPDDRIAGTWCEHFLGLPIDVERGLFNGVLENETSKPAMMKFQAKTYARLLRYLVKKNGMLGMSEVMRVNKKMGPSPLNLGAQTLSTREINSFDIDPNDLRELRTELLPYWKGRAVADKVDAAFREANLAPGDMAEFVQSMQATSSKQVLVVSLAAAVATYQGHTILDFETVLKKGLHAIFAEVVAKEDDSEGKQKDFYTSVRIALEGVLVFSKRLREKIRAEHEAASDPERKEALRKMVESTARIPEQPPETFREALQALWTVRTAVELAHITNVHALGRLDQLLGPYYERDIAEGRITREEAGELLEELLLKVMVANLRPESNLLGRFYLRYEGSTPITLGGVRADGSDASNALTYLLLEAAERSKTATSVVLRVHKNTPPELYEAASEVFYRGTSNLSLMNDEIFVQSMEKHGFSPEDSRGYAITGCTDALCPGKTGGISFSGLLLGRLLDMTFRNGDARTPAGTLRSVGPETGTLDSFETFEQLLAAFYAQADFAVKTNVDASNLRDRITAEAMPAPFISAFTQGCIETGIDVTAGGAIYDYSGINMINSIANVVDSFYVIKKLVYEQKKYSLADFLGAIDANYEGYEELYAEIKAIEGKWGNGSPDADALARAITTRLFTTVDKHQCHKGGPFAPFANSMTSHTMDGRVAFATPDGRKAATPYAASCNPYNVEKGGLTGVLRSVSAIDFTHQLGCAVNVRIHPSAIGQTPEARSKWIALIKTYFAMGGAQIQPTVASAETLRAAQSDPDNYRDLMVKVGGYSTYFVDLGLEIQNEVIARTEHGCC